MMPTDYTWINIFESLFKRVEYSQSKQYFCRYQEVMSWPTVLLESMLKADLLRKANQARDIICMECEKNCYKSIEFETNGSPFIYCYDPDELNCLIYLKTKELQQWSISHKTISNFIARFFDPHCKDAAAIWSDKGLVIPLNNNFSHVKLTWENQLCLQVNTSLAIPLIKFLIWKSDTIEMDIPMVENIGKDVISKHNPIRVKAPKGEIEQWMGSLPEEPRLRNKELIEIAQKRWPGTSKTKILQIKSNFAPISWQGGGAPKKT